MQQIKTWYYNHGRNPTSAPKFKHARKVTLLQVINRDHKAEVSALAKELSGGAQSGSQEHFSKYATALKTYKERMTAEELAAAEQERKLWDDKGLPEEIQIKNGLKHSKQIMFAAAESHHKNTGGRQLAWEYHHDKEGVALYHL